MPVKIHFLNVGHGDCTVVEHASGHLSVIDINNGNEIDEDTARELEESFSRAKLMRHLGWPGSESALLKEAGYEIELVNPVEYLTQKFPGKGIFRYIQSHPELDHMRGLTALVDQGFSITNFWDTNNQRAAPSSFKNDFDGKDWATYQRYRSGGVPGVTVLRVVRDQQDIFYNQNPKGTPGGDGIWILAPTSDLAQRANEVDRPNLHSYVLAVQYAGRTVILGGDADKEVWDSIAQHYGRNLKCDVLKASHHGRDSGYHGDAVSLMKPGVVVVSVGKKPDTDASNKYRGHESKVWSTRWLGTMVLTIQDSGDMSWTADYPERA